MKVGLLAVVLALALVSAACGGNGDESSATPTDEWAEGYCAAIVDWATELRLASDQLQDYRSLSQEDFEQAGADIRTATQAFTAELRELGAPDTNFGEAARQAVGTFATAAESDLADIQRAVEGISGLTGISKAVVSITSALTSMNMAFTTMVKSLRKIDPEKELQSALEDAESCDDLSG
ncbi:MAG: hypothetical protein H0U00_02315 [Actinobacteria bacterium]|nr:hypothetical protein [Actinomycetota bacterium]